MLLGFIRKSVENKFILAIDWTKVDTHMDKVAKSLKGGTRINLDPDALRWTPVISGHDLFRSPYKQRESLSPLKSPQSNASSGSSMKKKRRPSKVANNLTTTTEEDDSEDNMSLNKQRQLIQKKKRLQKLRKNLNLSGECEGLDGGGAENNISHEHSAKNSILGSSDQSNKTKAIDTGKTKPVAKRGRPRKVPRVSTSSSSSLGDDDDADDEGDEELELTSRAANSKKTSKSIPLKYKKNSDELESSLLEPRFRRAAANKASHRISKDSRRSMSMSSDESSSSMSSLESDDEDKKKQKHQQQQHENGTAASEKRGRKRKLSDEKENVVGNNSSTNNSHKTMSWPEQVARIKARNAPTRVSTDSIDSLEASGSNLRSEVPMPTVTKKPRIDLERRY